LGGIAKGSALMAGLDQFSSQSLDSRFFEEAIFEGKGYEAPHSFSKTELGDTEFGVKYNFFQAKGLYLTALLGGRAPTGSAPSLTNKFDTGSGYGNWATGAHLYQTWDATSFLSLGGAEKLTLHFDDTRERAVPRNANDSLPSLLPADGQVQDVSRSQPPKIETEFSATVYPFGKVFSMYGAHQYRAKGKDSFNGPGNLYYNGLADGTNFSAHFAEVGMTFSTIPLYRDKAFFLPMEIQALYNTPLTAENTVLAPFGRMDLIVYF